MDPLLGVCAGVDATGALHVVLSPTYYHTYVNEML